VPQEGALLIRTEFGFLHVPPRSAHTSLRFHSFTISLSLLSVCRFIAVVQRGIKFSVQLESTDPDATPF
jgi:hypothetical protein